jgi:hypothetical protein
VERYATQLANTRNRAEAARLRTVIRRLRVYADTLDTSPAPAGSDATDAPSPRAGFRLGQGPGLTENRGRSSEVTDLDKAKDQDWRTAQ